MQTVLIPGGLARPLKQPPPLKPYQCEHCGERFATRQARAVHTKCKHPAGSHGLPALFASAPPTPLDPVVKAEEEVERPEGAALVVKAEPLAEDPPPAEDVPKEGPPAEDPPAVEGPPEVTKDPRKGADKRGSYVRAGFC